MINPETVENINYFTRHCYWMLNAGVLFGYVAGVGSAIAAWFVTNWMRAARSAD